MGMGVGKNKKVTNLHKVDNVVWNHLKIQKTCPLWDVFINFSIGGFYSAYEVASGLKAN